METTRFLTGVKAIYFTPWKEDNTGLEETRIKLKSIVADSTSIKRAESNTAPIDCETSDDSILDIVTLGKWDISMESADVGDKIIEKCLGFVKFGSGFAAPTTYKRKYARIDVVMENDTLIAPRVNLDPNLDISTLKTGVGKGFIKGNCKDALLTLNDKSIVSPFVTLPHAEAATVTVALPAAEDDEAAATTTEG